jgi:hypothetical protein
MEKMLKEEEKEEEEEVSARHSVLRVNSFCMLLPEAHEENHKIPQSELSNLLAEAQCKISHIHCMFMFNVGANK